ncbi:MAG: hypothetical protein ACD_57C00156G0002 [uncultured bacterium]|uniref:Methyltransferase type 11 domain-containing protein n=1 Tax=Candidatus Woesebacteria bacterium RIFCSPLOWO2_01_FULL_39_21 TaxID=1802519 RepID=A0A1F8BHM4_9BACT|nr:MAG: hypothetical protein ACD_57C00156G0002 [uncultured bacterium]OGM22965.1 MAG: hypothetical protein A2691_00100 [Candidatus Woesebacteria bacterium RIFCSPHIGHO2_01_FULL_39_23]OGM63532.1 MAG: hypothetical protein A2961_01030 [Candidatus Woesebacteria bacterium RIFCSPLOWO2_01_FULL_39_21]
MFKKILEFGVNLVARMPEFGLKEEIRNVFYQDIVSERIIEYAWVVRHIPGGRKVVLDVGCRYSNLVLTLASLGYKTYGIDIEPYPYSHRNLKFITGDIRSTDFDKNFFDCIVAVSTLEHIGLRFYEKTKKDLKGDRKAIEEIMRILKPGGKFILTVPYGKWRITRSYRVYDEKHLKQLLGDLKLTLAEYFVKKDGQWMPSSRSDASKVDSLHEVNSVVFAVCQK